MNEKSLHGVSEATERTESGEAATVLKTLKHNYRLNEGFRKYLPLTDGTQLRSGQKKEMLTDGTRRNRSIFGFRVFTSFPWKAFSSRESGLIRVPAVSLSLISSLSLCILPQISPLIPTPESISFRTSLPFAFNLSCVTPAFAQAILWTYLIGAP